MLFNSVEFFIFFPLTTLLYFILPYKMRTLFLLAASCIFYMFFIPVYILILVFTIFVDYVAAIYIEKSEARLRKFYLIASIFANVGVLAFFKYYNFINENIYTIAKFLDLHYSPQVLNILLPIGLSFHTFQAMSYTREVYRGSFKAEKNLGIFALYVMFYPQLVAGPIERPQNLLPQFRERHFFDYARVVSGLKLMAWGMFKKVVIADRLSIVVNQIYGDPHRYQGIPLIIATICFAYQIYCDFSGYSDIAIGSARVLGFRLMRNFNRPYCSLSVPEFWKRWHISLSTWFKDYFYVSLGGNRVSKIRMCANIFLTFVISGLWHGASWCFIIWGAINGVYVIFSHLTRQIRERFVVFFGLVGFPRFHRRLKIICTYSLICCAWIFFRANNLDDAIYILGSVFSGLAATLQRLLYADMAGLTAVIKGDGYGLNLYGKIVAICSVVILEIAQRLNENKSIPMRLSYSPPVIKWTAYYALILSILFFGVFDRSPFIYFQF